MYHFENLQNKPLADRVEDNILSYIVDNKIEVGAKIPNEFELAKQFGVGRSTIREAIKMLASKRVLEVRRGAGTFVANVKPVEGGCDPLGLEKLKNDRFKLALDLIAVRLILEPEIAAMAAEFSTADEIEELVVQCNKVEKLILEGENHTEEDIKFHTCIAKCSKNGVVQNLVPIINSSVAVFVNVTHGKLGEETIETHRNIVEAIGSHDTVGAKCAMTMHLTYNRQMIIKNRQKNLLDPHSNSII